MVKWLKSTNNKDEWRRRQRSGVAIYYISEAGNYYRRAKMPLSHYILCKAPDKTETRNRYQNMLQATKH